MSRVLKDLRIRKLSDRDPLYQAAINEMIFRYPRLKAVRYQIKRMRFIEPSVLAEAIEIVDRCSRTRCMTLVEALHSIR